MSDKAFQTIFGGALFGIAVFVSSRVLKIALDQNKEIKEMLSQLEDCEEKLSQCEENHELKK